MSETYYKQCEMRSGDVVQIAWIPERFAEVGRQIILGKRTPDAPRWTVTVVADMRLAGSYLAEHERDYKTQRQASDI